MSKCKHCGKAIWKNGKGQWDSPDGIWCNPWASPKQAHEPK